MRGGGYTCEGVRVCVVEDIHVRVCVVEDLHVRLCVCASV